MLNVDEYHKAKQAHGPATVLAIATATPPNIFNQITYPDFYFRVTNTNYMTDTKKKFIRICEKSMIKKRHMVMTEEMLKENPELYSLTVPSLDKRQEIVAVEVPKLANEAAQKAMTEWGQPKSNITHLIFCTTFAGDIPGADYRLTKLLGLSSSTKRFMLCMQGCSAGGTVLRMAKDIAENNVDARVLAICSEISLVGFRGPDETDFGTLVGQALFGDGAGAVIVGSSPIVGAERPIFQLVSTTQTIVPGSEGVIGAHLREIGHAYSMSKDVPRLVGESIENVVKEAFCPLGIPDWNSIFWIVHPGGRAILDEVEAKLCLKPEKLEMSRQGLSEYGNMRSASVLFILDEMRKSSCDKGLRSTGEGFDWGILVGFGPGISVEAVVLHSMPN